MVGAQSFFDRTEVKDLISYLATIENPQADEYLLRILNTPPRGISELTSHLAIDWSRAVSYTHLDVYKRQIHQFAEEKKIKPGIDKSINAAVRFIHHPCHLRRRADIVTGKGRQVAHGRKGGKAFHEKAASLPWTGKPLL